MATKTVEIEGQVEVKQVQKFTNSGVEDFQWRHDVALTLSTTRTDIEEAVREHSEQFSSSYTISWGTEIELFNQKSELSFQTVSSALNRRLQRNEESETETRLVESEARGELKPGETVYITEKVIRFPNYPGFPDLTTTEWEISNEFPEGVSEPNVTMTIPLVELPSRKWISNIYPVYYDKATNDETCIDKVFHKNGKSVSGPDGGDVNKSHRGKFVYLKVNYTQKALEAADNIAVHRYKGLDNVPGWPQERGQGDLAKGAGGDFRFLDVWHGTRHEKLTEVALWDGGKKTLDSPPSGWQGMTSDLNEGRGGEKLYIIWKTESCRGYQ